MSTPAPPPANTQNWRPPTRLAVLLGQPGQPPTLNDEVDYLIPLSIERTTGGSRVDTITLEYDLAKRNERLVDVAAPIGYDREIEVVELDESGEIIQTHGWGKIGVQPSEIIGGSSGRESVQFKARIDHHLFGDPITDTQFHDVPSGDIALLDHDWIFNPEIDEKMEPNRSDKKDDSDHDEAYLFVDPESMRTTNAKTFQGQSASYWTIAEAVHRLIWTANPNETYISNPGLSEIQADLGQVPDDLFRNHKLKAGMYLPKALDALLEPYGCGWYVELVFDESNPGSPERIRMLRFFKDGVGTNRKFYLQRPIQPLLTARTNVENIKVDFSIVDLANEIEGRSSLIERETTFFLYPAWSDTYDSTDIEDLNIGTDFYKDNSTVGRKFVINTDGSYDGIRPQMPDCSDVLADLKALLGEASVARRHVMKPCLSRVKNADDEFESRGIYVEWRNPENIIDGDPDSGWEEVKGSVQVSQKEAAIFLGGDKPHEGIWTVIQEDPDSLEMRVTATFTGDTKWYAKSDRRQTSPNGDIVRLFLDLSEKFHHRKVDSNSIFYGDGTASEWTNAEDDMQDYLDHLRNIDDSAEVSVACSLEGIDHPEYELGQLVSEVEGRNLKFDANSSSSGMPRLLQVVAIILDPQEQRTTIELETIQDLK